MSNHHDRNSDTEKGLAVFPLECLVWLSLFTCIAFFEIPNASYIPFKSDASFFLAPKLTKTEYLIGPSMCLYKISIHMFMF